APGDDRLAVPEHRAGILELHTHELAIARRRLERRERLPAGELGLLLGAHREAEPRRVRIVEHAHVVAPRPEPPLEPERIEGERARVAEGILPAGPDD